MTGSKPAPPRPNLTRRPQGPFGWLAARLLHEGWLARLGPYATAVLVLLAIAADRRGASFYGRERMAKRLGLSRAEIDGALARLLDLGMIAHRPWRPDAVDGVWQLLPLPAQHRRADNPLPLRTILAQLGLAP